MTQTTKFEEITSMEEVSKTTLRPREAFALYEIASIEAMHRNLIKMQTEIERLEQELDELHRSVSYGRV